MLMWYFSNNLDIYECVGKLAEQHFTVWLFYNQEDKNVFLLKFNEARISEYTLCFVLFWYVLGRFGMIWEVFVRFGVFCVCFRTFLYFWSDLVCFGIFGKTCFWVKYVFW